MSEPENFLTRWSSRKLARRGRSARQDAHIEQQPRDENGEVENGAAAKTVAETAAKSRKDGDTQGNQPLDPAQLPPLDSIGAETNIAAFLRRDVPSDVARAALRRAWTSDPAIKNFVGLVENGWDFNDPSGMAGFGPISAEEVARLAGKVIEVLPEATPEEQTKEPSASEKKSQLASTDALAVGPREASAEMPEPGDIGHDAAQQSETGDKS